MGLLNSTYRSKHCIVINDDDPPLNITYGDVCTGVYQDCTGVHHDDGVHSGTGLVHLVSVILSRIQQVDVVTCVTVCPRHNTVKVLCKLHPSLSQ